MLTPEAEAEVAELARRFGKPRRWRRTFKIERQKDVDWARKTTRRRGEVLLVVPRRDGRVWLHAKRFYPNGTFRLPSGGIRPGESAEHAARREAFEELGFQIELARLVGIVENVLKLGRQDLEYPTFIFETRPIKGKPRVIDPDEAITAFRAVRRSELSQVARQLRSLPPEWRLWGRFRAAPHALLANRWAKERK